MIEPKSIGLFTQTILEIKDITEDKIIVQILIEDIRFSSTQSNCHDVCQNAENESSCFWQCQQTENY